MVLVTAFFVAFNYFDNHPQILRREEIIELVCLAEIVHLSDLSWEDKIVTGLIAKKRVESSNFQNSYCELVNDVNLYPSRKYGGLADINFHPEHIPDLFQEDLDMVLDIHFGTWDKFIETLDTNKIYYQDFKSDFAKKAFSK